MGLLHARTMIHRSNCGNAPDPLTYVHSRAPPFIRERGIQRQRLIVNINDSCRLDSPLCKDISMDPGSLANDFPNIDQ